MGPWKNPVLSGELLSESAGDQGHEGCEGRFCVLALGLNRQLSPACGTERHQFDDAFRIHLALIRRHAHLALKLQRFGDQCVTGAGVQPLGVHHAGFGLEWHVGVKRQPFP